MGGIAHEGRRLGHVPCAGLLVVELVQQAVAGAAESAPWDLTRHDDERDSGRVRLLQCTEGRQRARTRREEQHPDLAGDPGVTVCAERGVVLHPGADEGEWTAPERVEQSERMLPGDPEDVAGAKRGESLDDDVAARALGHDFTDSCFTASRETRS